MAVRGSRTGHFRATTSLLVDLTTAIGAFWLAIWVRHGRIPMDFFEEYLRVQFLIAALWPCVFLYTGLYGRERRIDRSALTFRVFRALVTSHLVLSVVVFYAKAQFLSRGVMALFFVFDFLGILLGRAFVDHIAHGALQRRTLVLGSGDPAARMAEALQRDELHVILGYLRVPGEDAPEVPEAELLGELQDLEAVIEASAPVDEIAVAVLPRQRAAVQDAVLRCEERGFTIRELLLPLGAEVRKTTLETIGGLDVLTAYPSPATLPELAVKRLMDICGGLVGLGITAALFPFLALAIKLTSRGPIFYFQERVGVGGRIFRIWKFRTMVENAHELQEKLREEAGSSTPHFTVENDPRVTSVGRFLRKTSLDEFPQFWNVLKGDMSLVGPRPFDVREVEKHEWHYHKRLHVRPGLTCIWQTSGRKEVLDFEDIVRMDEEYIRNWSLLLDVKLILMTIPVMIKGSGAR